jgi:hypothetical protein
VHESASASQVVGTEPVVADIPRVSEAEICRVCFADIATFFVRHVGSFTTNYLAIVICIQVAIRVIRSSCDHVCKNTLFEEKRNQVGMWKVSLPPTGSALSHPLVLVEHHSVQTFESLGQRNSAIVSTFKLQGKIPMVESCRKVFHQQKSITDIIDFVW